MNDEHAHRLVFDIETAPLDEAADYMEPVEPPANYKDPLKIAAYCEEKRLEQLEKCGLDVDLCRIVAIGWQREGDEEPSTDLTAVESEADLLRRFWSLAADLHLVGYNCLGFDLPVLLRRSLYLGVAAPHLQIDRFKHPRVTDLMDELSYGGKLRLRGLSFFCRRFGIAADLEDVLTGADIAAAVKAERWADIEAHVRADVQKTAALAAKLGYFHSSMAEAVL